MDVLIEPPADRLTGRCRTQGAGSCSGTEKKGRLRCSMPATYTRYLGAKKTVDDRALNRVVLDRLRGELAARGEAPLRVLEVGGGLGNMLARLIEWRLFQRAEYTLLDVDPQVLDDARAWLRAWAAAQQLGATGSDALHITGGGVDLQVRFVAAEIGAFVESAAPPPLPRADLLIANAVLDLVEVPRLLPPMFQLAAPGALYWFSINYDGETIFQPDHPSDEAFMRLFHRGMDERVRYGRPAGESRTGRHLFGHLRAAGASILAAGPSDWVVHGGAGGYPADEAEFLRIILDFVEQAVRAYPEVDPAAVTDWMAARRAQIDRGELVYLAHQLDFLGRCP
jgi:SAM-dependent methyltransferase